MYSVLNKLSEYIYFYIPKNITLYIFVLVFKIVESLEGDIKEHNPKVCNKDIKIFCQGFYFGGSFCKILVSLLMQKGPRTFYSKIPQNSLEIRVMEVLF